MNESSSVKQPVTVRSVCEKCGHLHRKALAKSCACCAVDINNTNEQIGLDL